MNTGYMHMFTIVAVIAMIGLIATFLLKEKGDVEGNTLLSPAADPK